MASSNYSLEDKDWNMNNAWLQRLNENLIECDKASRIGDLFAFYRSLVIVFNQIHWRLKVKGTIDEEKIEKDLTAQIEKANLLFKGNMLNIQGTAAANEILLGEINMKLNDLQYEYGFIQLSGKKPNPELAVSEGIKG